MGLEAGDARCDTLVTLVFQMGEDTGPEENLSKNQVKKTKILNQGVQKAGQAQHRAILLFGYDLKIIIAYAYSWGERNGKMRRRYKKKRALSTEFLPPFPPDNGTSRNLEFPAQEVCNS